jgi:hypothetical protein
LTVRLEDGTALSCERSIPRGGPGDEHRLEVPRDKFLSECAPRIGLGQAEKAIDAVLGIEDNTVEQVRDSLIAG